MTSGGSDAKKPASRFQSRLTRRSFCIASLGLVPTGQVRAETGGAAPAIPKGARDIPAKTLPVPDTVSAELQRHIAAPYPPGWDTVPADAKAWEALASASAAIAAPDIEIIKKQFGLTVEQSTIDGVDVFTITPQGLKPENRDRLLVHVHGGGYALYPGKAGAGEGMLMAGFGGFKVVSIDYRMPPQFPFPAPLDDAMTVWRTLVRQNDPTKMAIFGSSAGGGLTLAMVLKAKAEGLPLPAAIAPGTPWADLSGDGDSLIANAYVDNILVSGSGWVGAAAKLYASGHDLRDPLISPLYGDFSGFPPAIVTSGTRDLLLSQAVRVHRRLRRAGVEAALQVFEGQSHAQFLEHAVPETSEAFGEIAKFISARLHT